MIQEASVTGLIRTVLIIIGILFILRLVGRIMIAKREMDKENQRRRNEKAFEKEKAQKLKNFGKTTISSQPHHSSNEDYTNFEEVE